MKSIAGTGGGSAARPSCREDLAVTRAEKGRRSDDIDVDMYILYTHNYIYTYIYTYIYISIDMYLSICIYLLINTCIYIYDI